MNAISYATVPGCQFHYQQVPIDHSPTQI